MPRVRNRNKNNSDDRGFGVPSMLPQDNLGIGNDKRPSRDGSKKFERIVGQDLVIEWAKRKVKDGKF